MLHTILKLQPNIRVLEPAVITMLGMSTSALMTCPCHAGLIQHNLFDEGFSADFYHQESEVSAALPVQ